MGRGSSGIVVERKIPACALLPFQETIDGDQEDGGKSDKADQGQKYDERIIGHGLRGAGIFSLQEIPGMIYLYAQNARSLIQDEPSLFTCTI